MEHRNIGILVNNYQERSLSVRLRCAGACSSQNGYSVFPSFHCSTIPSFQYKGVL